MEACGFLLHFGSRKGNSLLKWHLLLGRLASGCSAPAELREGGGAGNITSPPHPRSLQNRTLRHWGDLHAASLPPAVTEAILHPHETVATSVSPSVGPGPVAAAAPENWLEMHVLGPIPDELHQKLANLWEFGDPRNRPPAHCPPQATGVGLTGAFLNVPRPELEGQGAITKA
ncbi:uncharacterized protein [Vulpes vulpes]|uniref:Uncharacterized protein isoform X3 n=1 Tax=Vulpes vulpes TaxID=9627 RepID=A0ABM4Y5A0_VULVU